MRWRWNGCPKPSRIFTTTLRQTLVVGRPGSTAAIIYRPCWCNRKSAQRREFVGNGSGVATGVTAVSRRVSLGRRRSHRPVAGVSGFAIGGSPGGVGAGRQRFSQAGGEVGGSGQAVLRGVGQDRQLPGWGVSGARGTPGQSAGGQAAVSAPGVDWGRGSLRGGGGASAPTGVPKQDGVGLGDGGGSPGQRIPQGPVGGRRFSLRDVSRVAGGTGGNGNAVRLGRAAGYDGLAVGTDLDRSALPG